MSPRMSSQSLSENRHGETPAELPRLETGQLPAAQPELCPSKAIRQAVCGQTSGLTRRAALISGTCLMTSFLARVQAADSDPATEPHPWIDAHSHIWTPDIARFRLRPGATIDQLVPRSFTDDELMAVAHPEGVGRVVLIQHYPHHGWDNSYVIDAWQRHPNRFRIVGMIDDTRKDLDQQMRKMLQQGVTGFRIGPREGTSDWLGTPGMQQMWKTAAATRQSMCCLINPEDLPAVSAMCGRYPETPVVIDHFARIGMTGEIAESDLKNLCQLSEHPQTRVKISAYYALGKKQPPHEELIPMIRRLFETFGADRLMWASDCPYQLNGESTYRSSISLIRDRIDFVSDEERRMLLQGTAERTFFFI